MARLYNTPYSRAGEGCVTNVDIPGDPGFCGVCSDSPKLINFTIDITIRDKGIH